MTMQTQIIIFCWALFLIVWLVSSFTAKRTVKYGHGLIGRIVMALIIFALLQIDSVRQLASQENIGFSPLLQNLGVLFTVLGIGFAIWARVYLGRNWGMPMSVKENRELVSTGPYKYVRHPIYSGMLLAFVGAVFVGTRLWIVFLVYAAAYFIYSAKREEKMLVKELPDSYPAYKARTKMLIPFVF